MENSNLSLPSINEDSQYQKEVNRAKELNETIKKNDRVIFIKDIPEQCVVKGLIAQIITKTDDQLIVSPVFRNLSTLSKRKITVKASTCVPIYYADDKVFGERFIIFFTSDEISNSESFSSEESL